MSQRRTYIADRIFTGENWLSGHAIVTDDGIITDIVEVSALNQQLPVEKFGDAIIAPAFIDLQIYGAHGQLLAVYPEASSLFELNEYCNKGGAAFCLPTVATNTYDVFNKCVVAIKCSWSKKGKGILGLHIEGPWINKTRRGAHVEQLIHSPTIQQAEQLLNYGKDVIKMITLAPEVCSQEVIDLILSHNIIISAGHSDATYEQATNSFGKGIKTVTHLYNAMSPLQHRAPGLVGATMDHDKITASIIPDGYHVDFAAIRIARAVMKERLFVITDAVTETDMGQYPHQRAGDKYESNGILSGSALTMANAVKKLVDNCHIELGEALRMCSLYPARVFGTPGEMGKIEKGYPANMVVMDENLEVMKLISWHPVYSGSHE